MNEKAFIDIRFEEWFSKVEEIAAKDDYELAHWLEQYDKGLTPLQAWKQA